MTMLRSNLPGWRVHSWRGDCRIVARWQLRPDDEQIHAGIFRPEIEEWARNFPYLIGQLYEAAYGRPAVDALISDQDAIYEEQIEEAFRVGRLLLVKGEPRASEREVEGSGGGPAEASPAPPPNDSAGGDETGEDSGSGAAGGSDTPLPPPKKEEKTWFRASLKDEDGEPMKDEEYILVDTDGVQRQGKLDSNGEVYIPAILPRGQCKITFPKIHLNPRKKK
jgi:hypothetical protein